MERHKYNQNKMNSCFHEKAETLIILKNTENSFSFVKRDLKVNDPFFRHVYYEIFKVQECQDRKYYDL